VAADADAPPGHVGRPPGRAGRGGGRPLRADAQKNTTGMLDGMLHSLGFQKVTVAFGRAGR